MRRKCGIVAVKVSISQFLSNALDLKGGGYCLLIRVDVRKVARGSCPQWLHDRPRLTILYSVKRGHILSAENSV